MRSPTHNPGLCWSQRAHKNTAPPRGTRFLFGLTGNSMKGPEQTRAHVRFHVGEARLIQGFPERNDYTFGWQRLASHSQGSRWHHGVMPKPPRDDVEHIN